jgi:hypothetical protein
LKPKVICSVLERVNLRYMVHSEEQQEEQLQKLVENSLGMDYDF